jgi:hypothetical protein
MSRPHHHSVTLYAANPARVSEPKFKTANTVPPTVCACIAFAALQKSPKKPNNTKVPLSTHRLNSRQSGFPP